MKRDAPNASASDEAVRLCDEGYLLLEAGRFDEAQAFLARALSLDASNSLIHYRLGLLFGDTGRTAEALQSFDEALRLDPGNVRAHNNRGSALQQMGRRTEAEAAYKRALELDPTLAPPYLNLGHMLQERGAAAQAVELYERAIAMGLDRSLFEQHRATALGMTTTASPESWVRATFDNFAPQFDSRLGELEYRVPRELAIRLLSRAAPLLDILDLGCGTGQCGTELARVKRTLVGVDLSGKMLAHARKRGVYDHLYESEIGAHLRSCATNTWDAVVSADVFIYIGDLEDVFLEVARVLRPGGWFAFSTEERDDRDFQLLPTGRYAQSEAYIRRLASAAFEIRNADPAVIRLESGKRLPGRLYLLERRAEE